MSGEPLYEDVGRRPMTDDELAAAIEQYKIDNPGWATYVGIESRLRRQNAEAREVVEAEAAGTTVRALRQARAEAQARAAEKGEAEDLAKARRHVTPRGKGPQPDELASFDKIEAKRIELARAGKPHGYAALATACGVHRSTVIRRYKGMTPPGEAPY